MSDLLKLIAAIAAAITSITSAVTYAPMPMNPPWPSETRPNRPMTDQEV